MSNKKAPTTNSIRTSLNEQLAKIQAKHNSEIEFLEDFRSFIKQRSAIEKEYAQGIQRLTQQFMGKRDFKKPPDLVGFDRTENRGMIELWKVLLDSTEEVGKSRMNVSEMLLNKIAEDMKQLKRTKEAASKKWVEVCQKMNSEILESAKEVTVAKKSYSELERFCTDARQKYSETDNRLRKKERKIFESLSSLEKNHKKFSDRLKSCQKRAAVSRNDYHLSIATTNAHLKRHMNRDLPGVMAAIDGEMYEKVRDAYSLYAQIELDACKLTKAQYEDLREQAFLVNRPYVIELYTLANSVLREPLHFDFEPFGKDEVCAITRDHGAEIFLDKDARKWAMKLVKCNNEIGEKHKMLRGIQSVTSAYKKTPEFGTADAQSEALQKIEGVQEEIRHLEVARAKAEARMEALREAGIDVSKWLQKATAEMEKGDPVMMSHGSGANLLSTSAGSMGGSQQDLNGELWDTNSLRSGLEDHLSDMVSITSESPKYCIVLYAYQAQRPDELNIHVDEELEVLEWEDGDGWCKGKNKKGDEGYFPQSYVQPTSRCNSPPNTASSNGAVMLKALYEYTAMDEEELTFPEGAVLELMRKDDNGIDDGWWEGKYEGKVGVFPSVVVEIISNGTEHITDDFTILHSPDDSLDLPPPSSSPPPLPPNTPSTFPSSSSPSSSHCHHDYEIGPSPVSVQDLATPTPSLTTFNLSEITAPLDRSRKSDTGSGATDTPSVTVQVATPLSNQAPFPRPGIGGGRGGGGARQNFTLDSFDSFDDEDEEEGSLV